MLHKFFFLHLFTPSRAESSWSNTTSTVPSWKPPQTQHSLGEIRPLSPAFIEQSQKEFIVTHTLTRDSVFAHSEEKITIYLLSPKGVIHLRDLIAGGQLVSSQLTQTLQNQTSNCLIVFCTQQLWVHFSLGWPGIWHVSGSRSCPYHPGTWPEEAGDGSTGEIRKGQEFETGHCRPAKGWSKNTLNTQYVPHLLHVLLSIAQVNVVSFICLQGQCINVLN